jgi:hypothetical protein
VTQAADQLSRRPSSTKNRAVREGEFSFSCRHTNKIRGDKYVAHVDKKDDVLGYKDGSDGAAFINFGRFYAKSYS